MLKPSHCRRPCWKNSMALRHINPLLVWGLIWPDTVLAMMQYAPKLRTKKSSADGIKLVLHSVRWIPLTTQCRLSLKLSRPVVGYQPMIELCSLLRKQLPTAPDSRQEHCNCQMARLLPAKPQAYWGAQRLCCLMHLNIWRG